MNQNKDPKDPPRPTTAIDAKYCPRCSPDTNDSNSVRGRYRIRCKECGGVWQWKHLTGYVFVEESKVLPAVGEKERGITIVDCGDPGLLAVLENEFPTAATSSDQGVGKDRGITISDVTTELMAKKIEFYRLQNDKIRQFVYDNKIGIPNQNIFESMWEFLESIKQSTTRPPKEEQGSVYGDWKPINDKWYVLIGDILCTFLEWDKEVDGEIECNSMCGGYLFLIRPNESGIYEVGNAVNWHGNNCLEAFKDYKVVPVSTIVKR